MKRFAGVVLGLMVAAGPASADVVTLRDGTVLEGTVRSTPDGYVVTDASGKSVPVAAADVQSMRPGRSTSASSGASAARTPDAELATLRRALAATKDPAQAVARYKAFLVKAPPGAAASDAVKDLAQWQERLDKGLVRAGDAWITPAERDERRAQVAAAVAEAAPLVDAGKVGEAESVLAKALSISPDDPALLYLKGLVLYAQSQLVPARKAFEAVAAAVPTHAPSHNNIAVILWQTRATMPALAEYEKAMAAQPGNQQVLDNVAQALAELPAPAARSELARRVAKRFAEQDAALQKVMAGRGFRRVGTQWVTTQDHEALQASTAAAQEQVAALKKEAAEIPTRLAQIESDIAQKTSTMNAIAQERSGVTSRGQVAVRNLPRRYSDLKQEVEALMAERAIKKRRLEQLPKLMNDARQTLESAAAPAAAPAAGQKLIDASGVPGAPAATQPTSRPS